MCKCCEYIKDLKEIEDRHEEIPEIKHIIKARITTITRKKGIRRDVGVIDWKAFPLNYCPMCRTKISRRWTKIGRKGGQTMTKEQEAIDYVQKQIDYFKEQIKFIEAVDSHYYDEEYELYKNRVKQFETVLSMLKEKDKEMEKKDKIIDLMSEWLYEDDTSFGYGKLKDINTSEKIKQYFERKVENETN